MSSINATAGIVLLIAGGWSLAIMGVDRVHASRQETSQDPANPDKQGQSAKQDSGDKQDNPAQDKQKKQDNNGKTNKKDKKDIAKAKGGATVTFTVLSDPQTPIKGAVVQLFGDNSQERKTTSADGKATFQVRDGPMTLRILADHMEPYQKQLSDNEKNSGLRVVLQAR